MIEVKNLVKVYSTSRAVDSLNFTVEKGQILGFLGPNGAGKSTTMNIITGYISATEGDVTIAGYDILKEPEKAKSHIGYLPEQPPIYMDMTVGEYLIFAAKIKGVKGKEVISEVKRVMDATKITSMCERLITNLSKGYKQRVGIAAALLGNPEVLILDEPTVGLDPKQIIEIRDLIKNLAKNHTVILSSHILQEISAVCDRIIIINNGKLVLDEMLSELNANIEDAQCLIITVKDSESNVKKILEKSKNIRDYEIFKSDDAGCVDVKIFSKNKKDIREEIFKLFVENNLILLRIYNEKKSLEDIFIEATSDSVKEYDEVYVTADEDDLVNIVKDEEVVDEDSKNNKEIDDVKDEDKDKEDE